MDRRGDDVSGINSEKLKRKCFVLVVCSLAVVSSMIFVPGAASPGNSAGTCVSLIEDPAGGEGKTATQDLSVFQWLFGVQRLEAACNDIAAARWLYVALMCIAALLSIAYLATGARLLLVASLISTLLLAIAAVADGPIVQMAGAALVTATASWGMRSNRSQEPKIS